MKIIKVLMKVPTTINTNDGLILILDTSNNLYFLFLGWIKI